MENKKTKEVEVSRLLAQTVTITVNQDLSEEEILDLASDSDNWKTVEAFDYRLE